MDEDLIRFNRGEICFGSGTLITKRFRESELLPEPGIILEKLAASRYVWLDGEVKSVDTSKKVHIYICRFPIPGGTRHIDVTISGEEDTIMELQEAYGSEFHCRRRDAASCAAGKLPAPVINPSDNGQKVIEGIKGDLIRPLNHEYNQEQQKIIQSCGPLLPIRPEQWYIDLITHYAQDLPPVHGSRYDYDIVLENDPDETVKRDKFIRSRVNTFITYYPVFEEASILPGEHDALKAYLARDRPVPRTNQPESTEVKTKEDKLDAYLSSRLPKGFTLLRVYRDHNCMFRALARLYYGAGNKHMQLRREIVDYVEHNYDNVSNFMAGETSAAYKKRLLNTKHAESGTGFELSVAVCLLQRHITVFHLKGTKLSLLSFLMDGHSPDENKTLFLVHVDGEHYHAGFHTHTNLSS
jgi:hypothetical protein